jgi:Tol biopolymer transport system component
MKKVLALGILIILLAATSAAALVSVENLKKLNIAETQLWDPALSPDGTKIAYVAYDDAHNQQVFVINADGTGETKLTSDINKKWGIAWGPDKIAYVSFGKDGLEKIFVMNPDGTDNKQLIPDNTRQGRSADDKPPVWAAPSWSHDGRFLVYTSLDEKMDAKLYMVNSDGTGKRAVFNDPVEQWSPSISPDGENIVYASYNNRSKEELFIVDVNGTSKRQITFDEIKKNYPIWGPDGTITYVSYESLTSSGEKIFAIDQDGTNKRVFVNTDYSEISPSFSLDGRKFSYEGIDPSGIVKITIGDTAGITATPTPTIITPAATTPAVTKTAHPTPIATQTPAAGGVDMTTMLLMLVIIAIVLLAILIIANTLSKK